MKRNVGAIYPQDQSYQTYKNEVHKILENEPGYFEVHKEVLKEVPWVYDEKLQGKVNFPSITHSFSIYCGLHFLIEGKMDKKLLLKNFFDKGVHDYIKEILIKSIQYTASPKMTGQCSRADIEEILARHNRTGKITLVKGSIYKIKRYFLENNNMSDIRGGSIIIDYLNNECIKEYIAKAENELCRECLIYSGGGNILLMVPSGLGRKVCAQLEAQFHHVALTVMNAFEYVETDIYELLFNFKNVTGRLNEALKERQKNKIYKFEPQATELNTLKINGERIQFTARQKAGKKICRLCDMRMGTYPDAENSGQFICPSCYRKYIVGKEAKSKHFEEYKAYLAENNLSGNVQPTRTLDDMKDENGMIAVLYGDGNNMGNIVININAPYEMMYFSDRTDQITKKSVYGAIHQVMGQDERFEVLAVGGDDLFFIVPAQYAPALAAEVVKRFDKAFNKAGASAKESTTMSVGICIGKYNMPIKAMFEIAQDNLKKAKKVVRRQIINEPNSLIEGTIDIVEMNGAQTIIDDGRYQGIFPITVSKLQKILEGIGDVNDIKLRCDVCSLFGKGGYTPSKVYVEDFKLVAGSENQELRSANCIDRYRKVCVEGGLFTKEAVYGIYEGNITAYIENEGLKDELKAAICLIKEIGSGKSRGLGSVEVHVEEVEA